MHNRRQGGEEKRESHQSAHDDLAGSSRGNGGGVDDLGHSLGGLGRLLDTTDRRLCGRATTSAAATSVLTTVADEVVERLVEVGRHCEKFERMRGMKQSWRFAITS